MYTSLVTALQSTPSPYETTGIAFWDDEHISQSMLAAHLAPEADGASRRHAFISESAGWIASLPAPGAALLDLGCGPGLYATQFAERGLRVTGMDFSRRSIAYATQAAGQSGRHIQYLYQDYLTMDYQNAFDIITLIYCDFGALPPDKRRVLLQKIVAALKPGGLFLMDAFTPRQYAGFKDDVGATFKQQGFWRPEPYLCIKRNKRYDAGLFLEQYFVLTEREQQSYLLWNQAYTQPNLAAELHPAGFQSIQYYADAAGSPMDKNSPTICAVCKK